MALKKFDEAVEECDYALKVHHKYMKAVLRRARCYSRLERLEESIAEYQRYLKDADTARQSPESYFKMPCVFDGPQKVTDEEYKTAKNELDQVCKKKKQKESRPRNDEGYNQERQKFREAAHNSSRSTFNSAHRRREQWHNQEGASGSRCFDPFNNGPGTKRSPKQRYKQQSRNTESSRRPSAAPENSVDLSGTHYGVLQIPRSAAQAEIKRAYKTVC